MFSLRHSTQPLWQVANLDYDAGKFGKWVSEYRGTYCLSLNTEDRGIHSTNIYLCISPESVISKIMQQSLEKDHDHLFFNFHSAYICVLYSFRTMRTAWVCERYFTKKSSKFHSEYIINPRTYVGLCRGSLHGNNYT
jgi:hypothetical protein